MSWLRAVLSLCMYRMSLKFGSVLIEMQSYNIYLVFIEFFHEFQRIFLRNTFQTFSALCEKFFFLSKLKMFKALNFNLILQIEITIAKKSNHVHYSWLSAPAT